MEGFVILVVVLFVVVLAQGHHAAGLHERVTLLEQAVKTMTPPHNLDTLSQRVNAVETKCLLLDQYQRNLATAVITTYREGHALRQYVDDTFFRKDAAT